MSPAHFAVNFFVALFALIDPVGNTPLFAAATAGAPPAGRRLTAAYIALFAFVFLTFFFVTGLSLLRFFGISLAAFRIAGGVLLFLLGLDMARGDFAASLADATDDGRADDRAPMRGAEFERLVVPFAMPLLIGPGAISTAVIYAGEARPARLRRRSWSGVGVIAATALASWRRFWYASLITRLLGRDRHHHRRPRARPDPLRHGGAVHAGRRRRFDRRRDLVTPRRRGRTRSETHTRHPGRSAQRGDPGPDTPSPESGHRLGTGSSGPGSARLPPLGLGDGRRTGADAL